MVAPIVPHLQSMPSPTSTGAMTALPQLAAFIRGSMPQQPLIGLRSTDKDPRKRTITEEREGMPSEVQERLARPKLRAAPNPGQVEIEVVSAFTGMTERISPEEYLARASTAGVKPERGMLLDDWY